MHNLQIFAFAICAFCLIFAFKRALQLRSWLRLKGRVIGPSQGGVDSSSVRIQFTDLSGQKHEFDSGIQFGHTYRTSFKKRIPFKAGEEVKILVNPQDLSQGELDSKMLFALPFVLFVVTVYIGILIF